MSPGVVECSGVRGVIIAPAHEGARLFVSPPPTSVLVGRLLFLKHGPCFAQECFNKSPVVDFKGKAGDEHRIFVCSGDLFNQEGVGEPWRQFSVPDEKVLDTSLKFLTASRGPCDVTLVFDGGSRKVRRTMEDIVGGMTCSAELTIVYNKSWNTWCRRGCFLGSANTEIGYVALPKSRGKFVVKARDEGQFTGAGEESNHYTSYTGVTLAPRTLLSRISDEEKAKVFKAPSKPTPPKWKSAITAGIPMFWQETKPAQLWAKLLVDLNAKVVVDLTPGSGVLACACMELGVTYFGMVNHPTHLQWLTNVVDRQSLKYTVTSGSFLYREDLATHVSALFKELIPSDQPEDNDADIQRSDDDGMSDGA
jgi:hypothetical protein